LLKIGTGFEPRLDQTKDDQIGMCCFLGKHAALRRNSKEWLIWNQDNVPELGTCSSYIHYRRDSEYIEKKYIKYVVSLRMFLIRLIK
jgi:hypothetical protein